MLERFELSLAADRDLEEIFDYTFAEFGADQAMKYVSSFDTIFEKIVKNPEIGRERNEIKECLRSISKEKHIVFYRILNDKIRIVRILHGARDIPKQFN